MKQADETRLEWLGFADFSAALLYEVLRFRQAIFIVEQCCAYPDLDGRDLRARHLLLRNSGAIAGYLRLMPSEAESRMAIGRVAVAPKLRHRGFARRLMREALEMCKRDYPRCTVVLGAQSYLVPFYASLGFAPVSPPYDDYGVPHIDMVLQG